MSIFNLVSLFFISNIIFWPFKISFYEYSIRLNIIIFFFICLNTIIKNYKNKNIKYINICILTSLSYIAILLISLTGPCENGYIKSILSFPLLLILLICAKGVSQSASINNWLSLENASIFCICITVLSILLEIIFPEYFPAQYVYRMGGIYSGLFDEPSHLGFSLFPCFLILLASSNNLIRNIGLVSLALCVILSPSSTLLLEAITISILMVIKMRNFYHLFIILIAILIIGSTDLLGHSPMDFIDKISQIYPATNNSNMSSLVYLQGWQDAYANLKNSHGFGLGFNMMGCDPLPATEARLILEEHFNAAKLNSQDGSFLLSKGISEFGIFFIFLTLFSLFILFKVYKMHLSSSAPALKKVYAIWGMIIFTSLFSMIVRSSSYFTGNFPLLIFALFAVIDSNRFSFKPVKSAQK